MAGIFVVQPLNPEKLIKKLKNDSTLWQSIQEGKDLIRIQNEL